MFQAGQVTVGVFGVARFGAPFDDDLDGLAFVLVEPVVDRPGAGGAAAAAVPPDADPAGGDQQQRDGDEPDGACDHRLLVAQRLDRVQARRLDRRATSRKRCRPTGRKREKRPMANDQPGREIGNPDTTCTSQPIEATERNAQDASPRRSETPLSIRNWNRISARRAPRALRMCLPITRVPFGDRDRHDRHDADAADHQRNR